MDIVLKPNAQRTEKIAGKFFSVISATAKFSVELDGRVRREVRPGSKVPSAGFKRASFFETEGVTNTIVYEVSDVASVEGEVQVSGVSNETTPYAFFGSGTQATGEQRISGTLFTSLPLVVSVGGVAYTRKSFHMAIDATTGPSLGIFNTAGELLDQLHCGTERTFDFNIDVKIKGIGGTVDITCYYTLFNTTPQ